MKAILVTGATGFVGSHMLDFLVKHEPDAELVGLRRPNSDMGNVRHLGSTVRWVIGDLCDSHSMESVASEWFDEVYHFGALSWVHPSWEMPTHYMMTNAIGTINLLEALLDMSNRDVLGHFPRVLVSCTPEEFGDVPVGTVLTETSPIAPVNPYAASKVAQDAVCQTYWASYAMPIVRTRAFNHEGPRRSQNGALASWACQIAEAEFHHKDPVLKVGDTTARRNFTHVWDMVRAYWLAMLNGAPGELYLIGSNESHTMQECCDRLVALSTIPNWKIELDPSRVRLTELHNLVGDYRKFQELTGWKPEVSFDELLRDILDYWRYRVRREAA
jgi:GDP-4-dehydro-6-deoxy-D-mannose reductase